MRPPGDDSKCITMRMRTRNCFRGRCLLAGLCNLKEGRLLLESGLLVWDDDRNGNWFEVICRQIRQNNCSWITWIWIGARQREKRIPEVNWRIQSLYEESGSNSFESLIVELVQCVSSSFRLMADNELWVGYTFCSFSPVKIQYYWCVSLIFCHNMLHRVQTFSAQSYWKRITSKY